MESHQVLLGIGLIMLPSFSGCQDLPPAADADRTVPNILLIVADDMGYADCGFTGSEDVLTPHLDSLAEAGVVLTDGHVSASVCAPSRAGLLTGLYQQRFGFECNLGSGMGLPSDSVTLPSLLRKQGYETVAIGKWHLGAGELQHPLSMGFDHFTGLLGGSRSYFPILDRQPSRHQRLERDHEPVPEADLGYMTDFLSDEAVRHIESHDASKPLFMYLSYTAPHSPNHARADLLEAYADSIPHKGRRTYAAMLSAMDQGIGRVTAALRARGELDNTLILFLSDNGGATGNHSDNGPWRGMKGSKWEGGQRVPFLVHWPARLAPGRYDGLSSSLDLLPTALVAAGSALPERALDGVDLLPHLLGQRPSAPHTTLYWRRAVAAAVREGDWKLVRVREEDGSYRAPILVNLAEQPGETLNVAAEEPELVQTLLSKLEAWEAELMDPLWLEGDRWERNQRLKHQFELQGREAERKVP